MSLISVPEGRSTMPYHRQSREQTERGAPDSELCPSLKLRSLCLAQQDGLRLCQKALCQHKCSMTIRLYTWSLRRCVQMLSGFVPAQHITFEAVGVGKLACRDGTTAELDVTLAQVGVSPRSVKARSPLKHTPGHTLRARQALCVEGF